MTQRDAPDGTLVFEFDFSEPPERLWKALSVEAFREAWLPARDLAEPGPVSSVPGREVRYRMREAEPPFLESLVTFQLRPDAQGGTRLRIIHDLAEAGSARPRTAANGNGSALMRAA